MAGSSGSEERGYERQMTYSKWQQGMAERMFDWQRKNEMQLRQQSLGSLGYEKIGGKWALRETPETRRGENIDRLLDERQIAALTEGAPVDPALERQLAEQETSTRNVLAAKYGSGYETTTGGAQRLGQFQTGANISRSQAGQSYLGQAAGISGQRSALDQQRLGLMLQGIQGKGGAGGQGGIPGMSGLAGEAPSSYNWLDLTGNIVSGALGAVASYYGAGGGGAPGPS